MDPSLVDLESRLLSKLKGTHSSLNITFNDHASNYVDVETAIADGMFDHGDWVSEEEKQLAIATNHVWCIQWYPDTPIGFFALLASTLKAVLTAFDEHYVIRPNCDS